METIKSTDYTVVKVMDEPGSGGACHEYRVFAIIEDDPDEDVSALATVSFQNGAIQEAGVNGCQNEDLMAIVIHRLQGFQSGDFKCRENAIALTHLETALLWLQKRTDERRARGVEGKSIK